MQYSLCILVLHVRHQRVAQLCLSTALMPGQAHFATPHTVPELHSILKWNLTKGHKDMHLSNEDTVCSSSHRVEYKSIPQNVGTPTYVRIYRTESCVPWLLTIDSTVCTNGVISSLATDPFYWLQFYSPLSRIWKRQHRKTVTSGRSQAAYCRLINEVSSRVT